MHDYLNAKWQRPLGLREAVFIIGCLSIGMIATGAIGIAGWFIEANDAGRWPGPGDSPFSYAMVIIGLVGFALSLGWLSIRVLGPPIKTPAQTFDLPDAPATAPPLHADATRGPGLT